MFPDRRRIIVTFLYHCGKGWRTFWVVSQEALGFPDAEQRGEAHHLQRRLPLAQRIHLYRLRPSTQGVDVGILGFEGQNL